MAGKRQATSNLNHDNWDQEEEPEERGTFRTATEDELKTRVIKKGRRKVTGGPTASSEGGEDAPAATKSLFSGFSGFGTPSAISGAKSPFSFLANLPAPTSTATATTSPAAKPTFSFMASPTTTTAKPATSTFGSSSISSTKESTSTTDGAKQAPATSILGTISSAKKEKENEPTSSVFKSSPSSIKPASASAIATAKIASSPSSKSESSKYRESVAELNRAIVKFLQEQMNRSAYCILTPVFENYEKHLKELKDEESDRISRTKSKPAAAPVVLASPPVASVASVSSVSSVSSPPKPTATFSFGKPSTPIGGATSPFAAKKPNCTVTSGGTTTTTTTPLFSFGTTSVSSAPAKPAAAPATSIFSFSSPKPAGADEAKAAEDAPKPGGLFSFKKSEQQPLFSPKKDDTSFSTTKKDEPVATPPKTNGFSFGLKSNTDTDKPSSSMFSGFGKPPAEGAVGASAVGGFSFTSGAAPFSFGNIKPPAAAAAVASEEAQDDEDKPPKVEFKQVVEDDAIYSKRCKVFVKKGNDYADRGIGTLYLKPVKDSEKTQMLVRADTNLGNILVNLILSDGIPCQRMGKNNVMMVCMPTPEETKVATMLLRVKTGEEADDLLNQIKKHTM